MFARVLELAAKSNKRAELNGILVNELVPLLKKQNGFVDAIGFISDVDPVTGIGLGLWKTKEEAERFYATKEYKAILDRITQLTDKFNVRTFSVVSSTIHKIASPMTG